MDKPDPEHHQVARLLTVVIEWVAQILVAEAQILDIQGQIVASLKERAE